MSEAQQPYLRIEDLTKHFGEFVAVRELSLEINGGEFVCFLGLLDAARRPCSVRLPDSIPKPPDASRKMDRTFPAFRPRSGILALFFSLMPFSRI